MPSVTATPPVWSAHHYDELPDFLPTREIVSIEIEGMTFACHLLTQPDKSGLLVWLLGSVGQGGEKPVIGKRSIGRLAGLNTLIISDPTLLQREDLRTGIFLGTESQNPIGGVIEIALLAAGQLGIPPEAIVFGGSSSGGFAALAAASRLGANAIALNAVLDIDTACEVYRDGQITRDHFRPGLTSDEWRNHFSERTIAAQAYLAAKSDRQPVLAIFQNIEDHHQYEEHFKPFCALTGALVEGGVSPTGDILTSLLDYPEGHTATRAALEISVTEGMTFILARRAGDQARQRAEVKEPHMEPADQ